VEVRRVLARQCAALAKSLAVVLTAIKCLRFKDAAMSQATCARDCLPRQGVYLY
jgi:hypothetical protein